jgi:DNA mismatch endonuclease (patch repair protein)
MDKLSPAARSRVMAAVRSSGNKSTERRFRALMVRFGIRGWNIQDTELPGKPDFIFRNERIVVFVDSCYWHGCPKHVRHPKTRKGYWLAKISGNRSRDQRVTRTLRRKGWRVLRIWEHDLAEGLKCIQRLRALLNLSFPLPPERRTEEKASA